MVKTRLIGAGIAAAVLALSACSGDNDTPGAQATATVTATVSVTVTAEPADIDIPASSDVAPAVDTQEYFELLATLRPEDAMDAADLAAPKSGAAAYAAFQSAYHQAELDSGFDSSEYAIPLEVTGHGFTLCPPTGEACDEITEVTTTDDGKIVNFKVSGNELKDVITAGHGKPKPLGDGEVKMIAAYHSSTGDVIVVFEVRSRRTPLDLGFVSDYRSPNGRQMEDTDSVHPSSLPPNSLANVALAFNGADLGGDVTYRVYPANESYTELTATFSTR